MAGPKGDERAWVRGAQAGNASDFEALFRAHWAQAFRAAYLVVHDAAAAEDIAQEAFLAAVRNLDRFDRRRPFGPWLHRIVVNRAIDWSRARTLRRESGETGLATVAASTPPDNPHSRTLAAALAEIVLWLAEPVSRGVFGSLFPRVSHDNERAALRVLKGDGKASYTQLSAAKALAEQGGIETLVVGLGANNALRSIVSLKVAWSGDDFDCLKTKDQYTVWRPEHFRQELRELEARVADLKARHVIWWSVPHVTIAPLAHGVGNKPFYSRYFTRYTYVFTRDERFDANIAGSLTNDEARVIDAAIDSYNRMIKSVVKKARRRGLDWYYFDVCGLLGAHRRGGGELLGQHRRAARRPARGGDEHHHQPRHRPPYV